MEKMLMTIFKTVGLLLLLSNCAWAQLTPEQEEARNQGLFFLNMIKSEKASPFLEVSAKAGDTESQYYLAEIIRRNKKHITPEAQELYEAAATKGDIYSMMRLVNKQDDLCHVMENCSPDIKTPLQWSEIARALAKERASVLSG